MQVKQILCAVGVAAAMVSCNNVDFKKTKGGMPYKLFTKGGPKPKPGSILKAYFKISVHDSVLQTNYGKAPAYIPVDMPANPYDYSELFSMLKKGDSVYAVQMVDTLMSRNPGQPLPPFMKKGDKIVGTFKVVDVFESEAAANEDRMKESENAFAKDPAIQSQMKKDEALLSTYMSQNGIQAQKTKNGTYVQVTAQGNGPAVENGKLVSLNYTGKTLAGKAFDSNVDTTFHHTEPLEFVIGSGQMMKGFEEGVQTLKKGDKARILIPSSLGYGTQGNGGVIPPNENLVFEVEVLDVKAPPAQMQDPRQRPQQ